MSKFICQLCPERCSLFCAQNVSEAPTRCQYTGKANWERAVEDKPPVYYTLPAPAAEPEIDYKKAFEMLRDLGIQDKDGKIRYIDTAIKVILAKCTKGGE